MISRDAVFSVNIFDLCLVEPVHVEPMVWDYGEYHASTGNLGSCSLSMRGPAIIYETKREMKETRGK